MDDGGETDFEKAVAAFGRKVSQAFNDGLERVRPAVNEALTAVTSNPDVRSLIDRTQEVLRHRPCLCLCWRVHPDDRGICETFDAVITGHFSTDLLGEFNAPICAPCAAARAAREFAGS